MPFSLGWLLLLGHPVAADDAGVVALEGLQGHLLRRLQLLRLQLLHLAGKHSLRRLHAVDAVRLGRKKRTIVSQCVDICRFFALGCLITTSVQQQQQQQQPWKQIV